MYLLTRADVEDSTYTLAMPALITMAESSLTICVACVPFLKLLSRADTWQSTYGADPNKTSDSTAQPFRQFGHGSFSMPMNDVDADSSIGTRSAEILAPKNVWSTQPPEGSVVIETSWSVTRV